MGSCVYDLHAVSLHTGGIAGGHYAAAVKHGELSYLLHVCMSLFALHRRVRVHE